MNHVSSYGMLFCTRVALGLASLVSLGSPAGLVQDSSPPDAYRPGPRWHPSPSNRVELGEHSAA